MDVQVVEGALSKCRLRKLRIVSCVLSLFESSLLYMFTVFSSTIRRTHALPLD